MPVLIKRYQNRKLYNTESKRYITLEEIGDLIKAEQAIKVIDNKTGKDITAVTLSQIIFEIEKNRAGFLPLQVLSTMVQAGGNRIDEIRRSIFESLSLFHHYDLEIENRINYLVEHGELSQEEGSLLLGKLLAASPQLHKTSEDVDGKVLHYLWSHQVPTSDDLKWLIHKVERLTQAVEKLSSDNNDKAHGAAARS